MCGIAGIFYVNGHGVVERRTLERMIYPIRHRGPDGFGFYQSKKVGLAHARLSIIDLEGGWQPIHNEDSTLWVVFNGEIFNYLELRTELEIRGHRFSTRSDTEVIIHLYEEKGVRCLDDLNGQFAIAIYDARDDSLFLARDRMGIRPLYYCLHQGRLLFASEVKSIFSADAALERFINPKVLSEIFTFWMPGGEDTVFSGIKQLQPGHMARFWGDGRSERGKYWDIPVEREPPEKSSSVEEYIHNLREILIDSVRLQLRSDVPVGAYLSGGIDSSAITSLVRNFTTNDLKTFSVAFTDSVYDERKEQDAVSEYLGTDHHRIECSYGDIATVFPDVIWHTETPILRTAPAPLFLLSGLVRKNNYKVVLTGEGADEILGGYDIFKEAKVRAFIGRYPDSKFRALLLKRLYPYLSLSPTQSSEYARKFFDTDAPISQLFYAHRPRWKTTERTKTFLSEAVLSQCEGYDPTLSLEAIYGDKIRGLDYFTRAQYVESRLLLANYLLSSQGDRMAMAHSVEGRFPFLDHRVVEYACSIPVNLRMNVLNEKFLLKRAMHQLLPKAVTERKKQPYMAPDILSFFGETEPDYLNYYLSDLMLKEAGLFKPKAVAQLFQKCRRGGRQGFRENMAFVGILSTQMIYDKFIRNFHVDVPEGLAQVKAVS